MTGIQQKDAGTPYNANWESILGLFVVIGVRTLSSGNAASALEVDPPWSWPVQIA
jgi:hypothetical protein